jgi:hypothetical protein
MSLEPLLYGLSIAVGKKIGDATSLEIYDDGAVPLTFEPGQVINPDETQQRLC